MHAWPLVSCCRQLAKSRPKTWNNCSIAGAFSAFGRKKPPSKTKWWKPKIVAELISKKKRLLVFLVLGDIYIYVYIYVKLHMKGMIYQQIICDICMNESYEQYLQRRYRGIVQELLPARV
jgi:hypothetical protein